MNCSDVRDRLQVVALLFEVLVEVGQRLDVRFHARVLRVGDEHHAVDAFQDQLARGVVEDLAGNGVEVKARLEAAHGAEVEREEVEEERAVGFRGEGDQLSLRLRIGLVVDPLQVGRLAAQTGTVIDDLAVDLPRGVVDERHEAYSLKRLSMSSSVISANGESKRLAIDAALRLGLPEELLRTSARAPATPS